MSGWHGITQSGRISQSFISFQSLTSSELSKPMFNKTQENLIIYSLPSENNSFPTRVNSWNIGYTLVNSYLASKTRTSDVVCKFRSDRDFLVIFIRYNFISARAKIMWFSRWDTYEIFTWCVDIVSLAKVEFLNLSYHFSPLHIPSDLNLCSRNHKKISLCTRYSAGKTRFRQGSTRDILVTN